MSIINLSDFYAGGGRVPAGTPGIPSSGAISIGDFYGASVVSYTSATGGAIASSGDYKIHTFTGSSTFTVTTLGTDNTVEYLVVAGGGSGGKSNGGGGGGAGGYRAGTGLVVSAQSYSVVVGAGGSENTDYGIHNGNNSSFSSITSTYGGSGQSDIGGGLSTGGSGGGAGWRSDQVGAAGTAGQGNSGGNGGANSNTGGGGGGASASGIRGDTPTNNTGGAGGAGSAWYGTTYAGGGGGGGRGSGSYGGAGGVGGGGTGGGRSTNASSPGTANTGGGGGAAVFNGNGRAGGSGIVIIKYKYQ